MEAGVGTEYPTYAKSVLSKYIWIDHDKLLTYLPDIVVLLFVVVK